MEESAYCIEVQTEVKSLEILSGGGKFRIPVNIKNSSSRDLVDAEAIYMSYHVFCVDGGQDEWDQKRYSINVLKGEEKTVVIESTAPEKKGNYIFQLDIVQEGSEWYSQSGVEFPHIAVKVCNDGSALLAELYAQIEEQRQEEGHWKQILCSGEYDFFHPYCKVDPYGRSPLTAVLLFCTKTETAVSVHVPGKTKMACVDAEFSDFTCDHIVPVYGLYPGKTNVVQIKGQDREGNTVENQIEIVTEKLKHGFEDISLIAYAEDEKLLAPGFNFCYSGLEDKGMKMAYDVNGDIRWYFSDISFEIPTNYASSSSVWMSRQLLDEFHAKESLVFELNYMGRIQSVYDLPYGIHHDIQFTSKDTMVILGSRGDVKYDKLIEVDLNTGNIILEIDYKKMLQRTRNVSVVYSNADWIHANSVIEHKEDFIVSGNTQSTIIKHSRSGQIKWMLADPIGYGVYWKRFLLKPVGRKFEYPYNQHAVTVLPDIDGNPDTVDILLFDNGYSRNKCKGWDEKKHPSYSRMVHYQINEKDMTVRQVWEYGKERPELFSRWRGDADLQKNGNIIGAFNVRQEVKIDGKNYAEHCVAVEVNQKKQVLWECYGFSMTGRNSYQNYRIERREIYDDKEHNLNLDQEVKIRIGNASGMAD
ncbi:MAG: aryl-sulfate sulfotransferase [Eubacterium sp.]|nr:aryl-sulfate sulfotransferase [Eubacterium sp.]